MARTAPLGSSLNRSDRHIKGSSRGRIRLVGTLKDHQGVFYLAVNIMRGNPVP
jgi:hypothetical protein